MSQRPIHRSGPGREFLSQGEKKPEGSVLQFAIFNNLAHALCLLLQRGFRYVTDEAGSHLTPLLSPSPLLHQLSASSDLQSPSMLQPGHTLNSPQNLGITISRSSGM